MSIRAHLTLESKNSKTGPIPVSTSSANSCPSGCPLRAAGCYARSGPLSLHWREVTEGSRGTDWKSFCAKIAALPEGQLWRLNQCGDLPHQHGIVDRDMVKELIEANRGRCGFGYTHHRMTPENRDVVLIANQNDLVINLSANNLSHADKLMDLAVAPVVSLVLEDGEDPIVTPKGRTVEICPAQIHEGVTCLDCQACADPVTDIVVGFLPHGNQRRIAERVAMGLSEPLFSNE